MPETTIHSFPKTTQVHFHAPTDYYYYDLG